MLYTYLQDMYLTFLNIQSRVFTGALVFLPLFSLALIGFPQFNHASVNLYLEARTVFQLMRTIHTCTLGGVASSGRSYYL